jgi:hypothetical protein
VPALTGFANAHLFPGVEVTDRALAAIERAGVMNADDIAIPRIRARLLAKAGRYEEAERLLLELITWARSERRRARYEDSLEHLRDTGWPRPVAAGFDFW